MRAAQEEIEGSELTEKYEVQYLQPARFVFGSIHSLLDPQVAKDRWPAALARLQRYVASPSLVELADVETREGLRNPRLAPPSKLDVENELKTWKVTEQGIDKLFADYKLEAAEPLGRLHQQLTERERFIREEVLPKARADFRLPPPVYAFQLKRVGVAIAPGQLTAMAHRAFFEIQGALQRVAAQVAKARGLPSAGYHDERGVSIARAQSPAQATAYFYGYTRLVELRAAAEKKLGASFDAQKFHDLILAQGLLPPDLLRKAVLDAL